MNRLGLLKPSELDTQQKELYDALYDYTTSNYGDKVVTLDSERRFVGPFGIHMHNPELGTIWLNFAKALRNLSDLQPEVRECAILGVGSRTFAAYENYAHRQLSPFTPEELDQLHNGTCPEHFSASQKMSFKLAVILGKAGPLDKSIYDEAVQILGQQQTVALIHYVGFYGYISTILNGFDAQVPQANK